VNRQNNMTPAHELPSDDRWLLTDGVAAIGPVPFDSVRRLVADGRVSSEAMVRHYSWRVWRSAEEISNLSLAHREETVRNLAEICAGLEARAATSRSTPPPPPESESLEPSACESERPVRSSVRPVCVDPVGILTASHSLADAMLLAVSTAAATAQADVGLLHRVHAELAAVVTTGGHGPGVEMLLGEKVLESDPSLAAARRGLTVLAEPQPGQVGRFILGRLARCIPTPRGAVMIPLLLRGELLANFEFGRHDRPFLVREVARMQEVIEALAERIVLMGWLDSELHP
jgi:hypothetical protein